MFEFRIAPALVTIGTDRTNALDAAAKWMTAQSAEGWTVVAPFVSGNIGRASISSTTGDGLLILRRESAPPKGKSK